MSRCDCNRWNDFIIPVNNDDIVLKVGHYWCKMLQRIMHTSQQLNNNTLEYLLNHWKFNNTNPFFSINGIMSFARRNADFTLTSNICNFQGGKGHLVNKFVTYIWLWLDSKSTQLMFEYANHDLFFILRLSSHPVHYINPLHSSKNVLHVAFQLS